VTVKYPEPAPGNPRHFTIDQHVGCLTICVSQSNWHTLPIVKADIDACEINDIALPVLASGIGDKTERDWIGTDSGWMAASRY
jgi:hypothetical protein